MTPIMPTRA